MGIFFALCAMRFVWLISAYALTASAAWAQPGKTYDLGEPVKTRSNTAIMTFQSRPSSAVPQTLNGLRADAFASGLGRITAIALGPKGGILLADKRKGRIIRLEDRGQDGRIDAVRPVAEGLASPSAIAASGETLFIADQEAIWQIPVTGGPRTELTSLRNANAKSTDRVMIWDEEHTRLILGLTDDLGAVKIIGVDPDSGRASLIAAGAGEITALAKPKKGPLWAGYNGALIPVVQDRPLEVAAGQKMEAGVKVGAIIVPGQYKVFDGWPETLSSHILTAQTGKMRLHTKSSGGFNIAAVPTVFGQPQAEMKVFADGFLSSSGRSAWGYPAAMAMDARGLMVADPQAGVLWRIRKNQTVTVKETAPDPLPIITAKSEPNEPEPQKTGLGSGIIRGSQIKELSTIKIGSQQTGSTIVKEWEEREAARKAAEEKSSEPE